jgi:DNA-binding NarL/FixJ family response regulator
MELYHSPTIAGTFISAGLLSEKEQEELTQITRRHRSEQQMVLRAQIVLVAAQGYSNARIARDLKVNVGYCQLAKRQEALAY